MGGFGKDEAGAAPSGRSSVPGVRGRCSAPPLPSAGVDEGMELDDLVGGVEHHVRRILERSVRGEASRAASCEPTDERSPSPQYYAPSPSFSPAASLCQSPCLQNVDEQLNLCIFLRLCRSRCGSSSAVLELILDHGADCNVASGCRCWPTPEDAEGRLLAHFARHSFLRLSATRPPVRVLLEPLTDSKTDGANAE